MRLIHKGACTHWALELRSALPLEAAAKGLLICRATEEIHWLGSVFHTELVSNRGVGSNRARPQGADQTFEVSRKNETASCRSFTPSF